MNIGFKENFIAALAAILATLCCISDTYSQCNGLVHAGNDTSICFPGGTIRLNGSAEQGYSKIYWTPNTGLNNPNILNPNLTLTTPGSYTYTLHGSYPNPSAPDLVVNGDFEQNNTGFSSDYLYVSTPGPTALFSEGTYAVGTNPNLYHSGFSSFGDHTTGTGSMMIINGSGVPNQDVWCQTINVTPNTNYNFSCWAASAAGGNVAVLQFSINGDLLGSVFSPPNTPGVWSRFFSSWYSGSNTTATICIVNQNTSLGGNDFVLDDILFKEECNDSSDVTITVLPENRGVFNAKICDGSSYIFGGQTFTQPVSGQDIIIKKVGPNNCDSVYEFSLEVIKITPEIDKYPELINCYNSTLQLDAGNTTISGGSPNDLSYHWATNNGHIVSGSDEPIAIIDKQGNYNLTVTYNDGDITCTATKSIFINADTVSPKIVVADTVEIGCGLTEIHIDAEQSSQGSGFTYIWSTSTGNILSGQYTLSPLVNAEGIYTLKIVNIDNGCEAMKDVYVYVNNGLPKINIKTPPRLDCKNATVIIDASGSSQGYSYKWSASNGGHILSGDKTLKPTVDSAGTYVLEIEDPSGKCKNSASITVVIDTLSPKADAGLADTLDCAHLSLQLKGSVNTSNTTLKIIWTGPGLVADSTTLTPTIDANGNYIITVVDTSNNCISVDSVSIFKDDNIPVANAGIDTLVNCAHLAITLDGSGSSSGSDISVSWTAQNNGNIVSGNDSYKPEINKAGTYIITVKSSSNQCEVSDTVVVGEDFIPPVAEAGADQLLTCAIDQLTLDGSGSSSGSNNEFSYKWSTTGGSFLGASDLQNPTVNKAGKYYISVTDNKNGCSATDSVTVNADANLPVINFNIPDTLTCIRNSVTINSQGSSTGYQFTYQWTTQNGNITGGSNTLSPTVNADGTYILSIVDTVSHCISTDSIKIMQDTASPKVLLTQSLVLTCDNDTLAIHLSPISANPITYKWFQPGNIPVPNSDNKDSILIDKPGTYSVQTTDLKNGCISITETVVTENKVTPVIVASVSGKINCKDTTVILSSNGSSTGSPYQYQWLNVTGNKINTGNNPDAETNQEGVYFLHIIDSRNGCYRTQKVVVQIDTTSPVADITKSGDLDCINKSVALSTTGPLPNMEYLWTGKEGQAISQPQSASITVNQAGNYELLVTNTTNHCTQSAGISVTQAPLPTVDIDIIQPACPGDVGSILFKNAGNGTPPYRYSIDNGTSYQADPSFLNLLPGNYATQMIDSKGCAVSSATVLDKPLDGKINLDSVYVIFLNNVNINATTNIPASEIESIQWLPPTGLSCDDCLNPIATTVDTIYYDLVITTKAGCVVTGKTKVYKRIIIRPEIFVPNVFTPNEDGTNDKLVIYTNNQITSVEQFNIYNRWGDLVYSESDFPPNDDKYGWDGFFRSKLVNAGVYVYWVKVLTKENKEILFKGDVSVLSGQ